MHFRLVISALAALALSACSDDNKTQQEEGNAAMSNESAIEDPFVNHFPWDETKEGVVKLPSGLQYLVLASGDESGPTATPQDYVTVHYDGRLASTGQKFDSSYDRGGPASFIAGQLIPGWVEALQLMRADDEWLLFIPSDLGYGARGAGRDIPPNADLMFRLHVLAVGE